MCRGGMLGREMRGVEGEGTRHLAFDTRLRLGEARRAGFRRSHAVRNGGVERLAEPAELPRTRPPRAANLSETSEPHVNGTQFQTAAPRCPN